MTSHAFTKRQGTLLTTPSLFSQQYHLNLADGEKKKAERLEDLAEVTHPGSDNAGI